MIGRQSRLVRTSWLLAAGLLLCGAASAQEAGVRTHLEVGETVWVGQEVKLVVELLAPGYFASSPRFDLPDPEGVLMMPPAGHPVVGSETIDGTSYTVQTHEVRVWPMRNGDQIIPALTVRFAYKRGPLDSGTVPASVTTPAIPLSVQRPPGSEQLGTVISARQLSVKESWEPEPGTDPLNAGAAFKRTVTFTAPDVPGMVFPPFPSAPIDGLSVYARPQLLDQDERGTFTGVRRDEITYVCQRPGQFTIPATRFTWFDLESGQLQTEEFPEQTLNVIVNPAMASAEGANRGVAPVDLRAWRGLGITVLAVLLLILAARSVTLIRIFEVVVAAFRPVRLQPLNPYRRAVSSDPARVEHS